MSIAKLLSWDTRESVLLTLLLLLILVQALVLTLVSIKVDCIIADELVPNGSSNWSNDSKSNLDESLSNDGPIQWESGNVLNELFSICILFVSWEKISLEVMSEMYWRLEVWGIIIRL